MLSGYARRKTVRILHLVNSVGRGSFGLGPPASFLGAKQQQAGETTEVWTIGDSAEDMERAREVYGLREGSLRSFKGIGSVSVKYSYRMMTELLSKEGRRFDLVHEHGIWTPLSWAAWRWQCCTGGPVVVAAQGCLQKWALKKSVWKKKLALWAYEARNLNNAACLQAVAETEVEDYRRFGLKGPVAVIPNGIDEDWINTKSDVRHLREELSLPEDKRLALFLSRITPKKGLPMLIEAVSKLRDRLMDWLFIIAGADEFNHEREIQALIYRLGVEKLFRFVGPIYGRQKRNMFAAADLFILPTYSEGAPIVILEALGAGIPVLTTKGAPWPQIADQGCGWWTEISAKSIQEALNDAIEKSPSELNNMGKRGCELVRREYLWTRNAQKTIKLYRWLLDKGEKPEFVHLD